MIKYFYAIHVAMSACLLLACSQDSAGIDPAVHEAEIERWRVERVARLKGPVGFLNLAGLFWLQAGELTLGSAPDSDIVLPGQAASRVGTLQVRETGVHLIVAPGADVRRDNVPVQSLTIDDDTTAHPVTVAHGTLAWTIIKRDDRFALRLRDYEHPAIDAFPPIEYFPIDLAMRVRATLRLFDQPKILNVGTVIEGLEWQPESPGVAVFEIDGTTFELDAYASGDRLFFVFGDQTSGRDTYPAGRFLYADLPADRGTTILDFNRSYNPPCAFNAFATCPVASPQNRLATRIEAGEKFDPNVHETPDFGH